MFDLFTKDTHENSAILNFKVTLVKFCGSSSLLLSALTIQKHSLAYVKKKIKFFGLPVLLEIRWIS